MRFGKATLLVLNRVFFDEKYWFFIKFEMNVSLFCFDINDVWHSDKVKEFDLSNIGKEVLWRRQLELHKFRNPSMKFVQKLFQTSPSVASFFFSTFNRLWLFEKFDWIKSTSPMMWLGWYGSVNIVYSNERCLSMARPRSIKFSVYLSENREWIFFCVNELKCRYLMVRINWKILAYGQ